MIRTKPGSVKRLKDLEQQIGNQEEKPDLFQMAMAEVLQEATAEELYQVLGLSKRGPAPIPQAIAAMHEILIGRAEQKVKKYEDDL
jgi:predicted HAD superfamily Cof-like phosphohydrolase